MYTCEITYTKETEDILLELCCHPLIHSFNFFETEQKLRVKTRKLWKLYWLHHHFRNFEHEFSYCKVSNRQIPNFIISNYKVTFDNSSWFYTRTSIFFTNIHDVWKIRFATIL